MTSQLVVGERLARHERHRRVQPQRLVEHGARERQAREVGSAKSLGANRVHLLLKPVKHQRVAAQLEPRPREGVRGGLVTGDEERDDLVPQVRDRHAAPRLGVWRGEEPVHHAV